MEEEQLIKIAFVCVLTGIPLLYAATQHASASAHEINEHAITGKIVGVQQGPVTKAYVEETRRVPVVIFDEIEIEPGVVVRVSGEFDNEEFIANEITPHRIS